MDFRVLRAPGAALGLAAFALVCALMPALGLGALLPLQNANAGSLMTLALVGGMAAPFIFASIVFATLAVYLVANALHVEVNPQGARHERRVFGILARTRAIARSDIAEVALRIAARHQNLFSREPRYTLVARHKDDRTGDVVLAEDVRGQALAGELAALLQGILGTGNPKDLITDERG
jgi:hypothetical protein